MAPCVFVLAEQNFPATIQVMQGEGECLKVFRIEDSSLIELANGFLEAARGFAVPAGSVLVLTSAKHLTWVGAGAYTQDFMAARHRLRAAYRGGVEVIHGVPILVSGVGDCAGAAAIKDFFL
jgi:hypothetical protein